MIGDYGIKRDDVFQRLGSITQLGVGFEVIDGTAQSTYQFKSEGAVDLDFVAKGDVRPGGVPAVRAGIEIRFNRQDAVLFSAAGCTITQIADIPGVGAQLTALLEAGRWDTGFYVVTSIVKAAQTTAIVSSDRSSEIALEATSDALAQIDLADTTLKLRTKRSRSTALEIVTASDQTPLMQLSRLRGLFRKTIQPELARTREDARGQPAFELTADDDGFEAFTALETREDDSSRESAERDERVSAGEFRFEAAPAPFEVQRAINGYIPLLEACYALAKLQPIALPNGYVSIGEVRASVQEMAEAVESAPAQVREAVRNDMEAAAAIADPSAFGFVVREERTGAILVCIRGTQTPREWLANFTAIPSDFSLVPGFGLVHLGFEQMYGRVRRSIQNILANIGADVRITVLGHSLGGAMATLGAVDIKRNMGKRAVDLCTVGGPRVGKIAFRRNFNLEIPLAFRVTNQFDIVPHVPSIILGWNHVGEEIEVDGNVDNAHSLEAYLRGLQNIGALRELSPTGVITEAARSRQVMSIRVP